MATTFEELLNELIGILPFLLVLFTFVLVVKLMTKIVR